MSLPRDLDTAVKRLHSLPMNRRGLLRLAAASGTLGLLAACSSKAPGGSTSTEPASSGGTASTATTASSGGTASTATTASSGGTAATATSGTPAAGAAPTTAPSTAAKKKGGTLTIGVDQEPPTMDPHASPSAITFYITASNGESLLYLDSDRQLKPWLAASYEAATDGKSFTFKLIQGVTFQDGATFDAKAAKWNFDRIVDPNYKAGSALSSLSGYVSTDVVDDSTIKITFKDPYVPFITYAAGSPLSFVSPTGTPKQGDAVNQTPITTGPYKLTEYVPKDHCTMARWDDYKRKLPWASQPGPGYLDKVIWKFIPEAGTRVTTVESGETQMATVIPSQDLPRLEGSKDLKVQKQPWTGTPQIWLITVDHPPTDDVKVRQAINYAINRDAIVNTVYKGIGTVGRSPLTKVMLSDPSLDAYYPFDQNKAKQLLDDAGWKVGSGGIRQKDGQPLKIVINSIDYGGGPQQFVILIQGQLHDVGIDCQLKVQARPPWYEDNYKGATNGPVMFLRSGDWDGLYALFHSSNIGGNFNWSRLNDPDMDKMLTQGRAETDPAKRKALYLDIEKKLMDLAACAPLVDELSVWAYRANYPGLLFNGYTYPVVTEISVV